MAFLDDLIARRNAVAAELAAMNSTAAGGKPNSATSVDHQGYKAGLYAELEKLNGLIASAQSDSDGPWEECSQGAVDF